MLVAIPLVISLTFIFSLRFLLHEASLTADREARSKETIGLANKFGAEMIQVGAAYYIARTSGNKESFMARVDRIRDDFNQLEMLMGTTPERKQLLGRIRLNLENLLEVLTNRWEKDYPRRHNVSLDEHLLMRDNIQGLLNAAIKDMNTMVHDEKILQKRHPMTSKKYRTWIDGLLLGGIAVNLIVALGSIAFFSNGITRRLSVLSDNSRRLADDQPLNPVVTGNDEIAELDKTFHYMADKLSDARSRERAVLDSLTLSEARLRSMLDTIPLGLIVIDQEEKVGFLSPSAQSLFGYTQGEFEGRPLTDLFATGSKSSQLESQKEIQAVRSNGSQFPAEILSTQYNTAENAGRLLIVTDITQKYEMEKLKQSFVSMVSHELKSPLMSIQTSLKMLTKGLFGTLSSDGQASVGSAEKSIVRLIALVNEILDVERLESGTIRIDQDMVPLKEIMDLAVASVKALAEARSVTIVVGDLTCEVFADKDRIVQVVVNLLSNAIKFSEPDSRVLIDAHVTDVTAKVSVTDFGRGIPLEHQELIFNRFHQVNKADAHEKGGSGLGLAICRAIIASHGGSIGVQSQVGKGSTFWFTLCLDEQTESTAHSAESPT